MKKKSFLPWIEENFNNEGFAGRRIPILGESHYCANAEDANEGFTIEVTRAILGKDAEFEPFFDTLETLRPDIMPVWGSRIYNNLPKGGMQGDDFKAPDDRWIET